MYRLNKIHISIVYLLFFLSNLAIYSQQQSNIEISQSKVSIDGIQYYIHNVKEGQTLYSISKAYNVNEKEIIKKNPGAEYGLKIGQSLKIPVFPETKYATGYEINKKDSLYIYHITKPGETMYSLSKIYNVPEDTIKAMNPSSDDILISGAIIKIPKLKEPDEDWTMVIEERTIKHYVEKGENLISIARKYDVPFSNIIKNNKWGSIKPGNYIDVTITDTIMVPPVILAQADIVLADTIQYPITYFDILTGNVEVEINKIIENPEKYKNDTLDIALLLPFKYKKLAELNVKIDTCETKEDIRSAKKQRARTKIISDFCIDLYLGTLLAIDSIKKTGVNINYSIFDTEADSNLVRYYINKYNLKEYEIIIGPLESSPLNVLLDYLGNSDVKIILPTPPNNKNIDLYSNVYQLYPSEEVLKEHLAMYVASQKGKNIILLADNDSISKLECAETEKRIARYSNFFAPKDSINFEEIFYSDTISKELTDLLSDSIENVLVVISKDLSSKAAFISNIIRELIFIEGDYPISVIGDNNWGNLLDNIKVDYLHKLNVKYATPFFMDYNKTKVKQFLQGFRDQFKSEPYQKFGGINPILYGYDIMMYFASSSKNNSSSVKKIKDASLLTDFELIQKNEDEKFENISVTFIVYENNFEIKSFKPYSLFENNDSTSKAK